MSCFATGISNADLKYIRELFEKNQTPNPTGDEKPWEDSLDYFWDEVVGLLLDEVEGYRKQIPDPAKEESYWEITQATLDSAIGYQNHYIVPHPGGFDLFAIIKDNKYITFVGAITQFYSHLEAQEYIDYLISHPDKTSV